MYLKKALRGTILIFIYSIIAFVIAYIFRIILARSFSVAEYGLFYAVFAFFSTIVIFTDLGLGQAVLKHVVDFNVKKQDQKVKSILVYSLYFQVIMSIVIFLILLLFMGTISKNLFKTSEPIYFILMGIWFVTISVPTFLANIFLGFKRPEISGTLELFRQVVAVLLTLLFLFFNLGIKSPFLAYASINILMIFIYAPFIRIVFPKFFKVKSKFDKKTLFKVIQYGFYVALAGMISVILTQTDTIMLTYFKGLEAVGLYQVAVPIAGIVAFVSTAIVTVSYPLISELYTSKKIKELREGISLIYKYGLILSLPIAIVIISYSETIISLLFGAQYLAAALTLKIMAVTAIFGLLLCINNSMLLAMGFPKIITRNMFYAALLNIALNVVLIPKYSIVGAATATLISTLIALILSLAVLKKKIRVYVPIKKWFIAIIISVLTVMLMAVLKSNLSMNWILETAIIFFLSALFYSVTSIMFKVVDINEIKYLIRLTLKNK
jgi:O-antigen/teichoic acid export membrane protein